MISARFRGTRGAFDLDVAFEAPDRGVTALFGPSGSGKTSVLRCVAGLDHVPGRLALGDGTVWQDDSRFVRPHLRGIGYVFQEPSLFPHLDVSANLHFGLRRARNRQVDALDIGEVVDLLGMEHLVARNPSTLSGGERQRVAIGRALLSRPRLILMDEPLASLDRASKAQILPYLERLRDRLPAPMIYVSHDLAEIERIADHLVLIEAGVIVASGPIGLLQADPSLPIARLPEAGVTLPARIVRREPAYGTGILAIDGARLIVPDLPPDDAAVRRVRIAATDVSLARSAPSDSTILNVLPSRIVGVEPQAGARMLVVLALGSEGTGARLLARVTRRSWDALGLEPGQPIFAQVKGVALVARGAG